MKYFPTDYARRLDEKRAVNRRVTWSFIGGCLFMALLLTAMHLAARDLGL